MVESDCAIVETWRPVVGLEDTYYQISSFGRVRRPKPDGTYRYLIGCTNTTGHVNVCMYRNGVRNYRFLHCMVLDAFVGPCPEGMECRHFDGDPKNNWIGNLKWGTRSENANDSIIHGTFARGERSGVAILDTASVIAIRRARHESTVTYRELAAVYKVTEAAVRSAAIGENWAHIAEPIAPEPTVGKPKLTEADVVIIRGRRATTGETYKAIAKDYGIEPSSVRAVVSRRSWKNVP